MTGHRTRISVALVLLALVAVALPAGLAVAAQAPFPASTAGSRTFLPIIGLKFPTSMVEPSVRFWSERYTLDEDQCIPLHWDVTGAKAVSLDAVTVAPVGTTQACPLGRQFYSLSVEDENNAVTPYELVLDAGSPGLLPSQVIAQATVKSVTPAGDIDPNTPGDQQGYMLQLKSVVRLYADDATWAETAVTLGVQQSLIDFGFNGGVHWPVAVGQQVEFRANCQGPACLVIENAPTYLYLRSK